MNDKIQTCEINIPEKANQIETLEKILSEDKTNKHLKETIKKMDTNIEGFEVIINTMKKCAAGKYEHIVYLVARVKDLESKIKKNNRLDESIVKVERSVYVPEKTKLLIEFCDFCDQEIQNMNEKYDHARYTKTFNCELWTGGFRNAHANL